MANIDGKGRGYLFIGASESIGEFTDLFEPADRKQKIYSKKAAPASRSQLPLRKLRGDAPGPIPRPAALSIRPGRGGANALEDFNHEFDA